MKRLKLNISILLVCFLSLTVHAHRRDIILSDKDGLSGGSVRCILQDSKGYMWFGSWNGLDRYDGHSFLNLKSEPGNVSTIHDNVIEDMTEAGDGSLWVLTETGLSRVRDGGSRIESYSINTGRPIYNSAKSLDVNGRGDLFCSVLGWGLSRFEEAKASMIPVNLVDVATSDIQYVACNTDSTILIQTVDGRVLEYGFAAGKDGDFETTTPVTVLDGKKVRYTRRSGRQVFLFTSDLAYMVEGREVLATCPLPDPSGIVFLSRKSASQVTVGFEGSRSWTLDFETGSSCLLPVAFDGDILYAYHGSDDITWTAIDGLGVCESFNENMLFASRFSKDMEHTVLCLEEVADGLVMAGTIGDGIYVAQGSSEFRKARVTGSFSGRYVFSTYKSPDGEIFVGGYDEIGRVRSVTGGVIAIDRICSVPGKIYSMYIDEKRGHLWAGTFTSMMRIPFTRSGGRMSCGMPESFVCTDRSGREIELGRSMSLVNRGNDDLVIGTTGSGIYIIDLETDSLRQHLCAANGELSSDNILTLRKSSGGKLLAGTSYGLNIIDIDADGEVSTTVLNDRDGIVDNTVHSILEAGDGRIWISTNKGIAVTDPLSGDFEAFLNAELQSSEFCNSSCLAASDGTFWFGGTRGCDSFRPQDITSRNDSPVITFRSFATERDTVSAFAAKTPIVLRHNDNFFSVSYGALEFVRGRDCEYRYRLEGLNSAWAEAGTSRNATFTNVPPGHYRFEVYSTNGDKQWCDNLEYLSIVVKKPWWETNLALILYLLMVMLLIFSVLKIASYRIEQKHQLDIAHLERKKQAENYEGKLNFFTNLAHEFGTPLTLISTSSEQLLDTKGRQPSEDRYLNVIHKSAERMQRLISELVEFRKIDSGSMRLRYSHVDVNTMVEGILDDFYDVNQKKHSNLQREIPQERISLVTDSNALETILYNLLSNAYKYVTPYGDILMKVDRTEGGAQFVIRNSSAKGIKPEDLAKMFDRYSILDTFEKQAGNEKVNRNGLGLAIVKDLVDMLGGKVSVSNEENRSVQFTLFVPDDRDHEIEDAPVEDRPFRSAVIDDDAIMDTEENAKSGFRIMVVEDDDDMRAMVSDILQAEYEVVKASDGQEALQMIDLEHPDLVVTDLMMPKMDGAELLQKLRSSDLTRLIPVVFLTFKTDIESELKVLEMGGDAFIHKPFHRKQLLTVVRNILYRRTSLKSYYSSMQSNMEVLGGVQMSHEDKDFIYRLTSNIETNITDETLSLDFLADKMAISKMTLYRKIKDITGQTPSEFINKVKINRATHLLKTTNMTIQEVMFASGYNNKSYFYRKFAEANGMTPKEFRENQA